MPKTRDNRLQTAQGMVEFALVLPILLLIIFGVFAFGHLFFSYSSVVSASREAARWGSAAGVSESMRPRYSDCDSIRAAAVRVGSFAGVEAVDSPDGNTPGVAISFDHGPNDPNPPYDDCSDGLGAGVVGYGDRINVRVTIQYRPIVPLVNIPTFPLTATTSRTIIKSLPVGDAPAVQASCPTTTIIVEILPSGVMSDPPVSPVINQPVDVRVHVIASDGTSPRGTVDIVDYDPNDLGDVHTCTVTASSALPGQTCHMLVPEGYETAGTKYITALYDHQGFCFQPSELINEPFEVAKGNSVVQITADNPDPSWPYNPDFPTASHDVVLVEYTVSQAPVYPGYAAGGHPNGGRVTITDQNGNVLAVSNPINNGYGSVDLLLSQSTNLIASYEGDINYNPSPPSLPEPHTIRVVPTPTPTSLPDTCPFFTGMMDFSVYNTAMQGLISNTNGQDTAIESVQLQWPTTNPAVQLVDLRFGDGGGMGICNTGGSPGNVNCLWHAADPLNGLNPPSQTIDNSTYNWLDPASPLLGGTSKYIRFTLSAAPPAGPYSMSIHFQNGCILDVAGNYRP